MWPSLVSRTVPLYRVGSAHVLFPFKILIVFIWEGRLARLAEIPVARAEISASKPPRHFRESVDKLLWCYHWNKNSRAKILHRVSHIFGFQEKKKFLSLLFFLIFTLTTIRSERCDGVQLGQLTLFPFSNVVVALAYIATAIPLISFSSFSLRYKPSSASHISLPFPPL